MLSASRRSPRPSPRRPGRGLAPLALLLAACSTLPPAHYPSFSDHDVTAAYVVGDDGRLAFPATNRELVVDALRLDPPPLGERFAGDGRRWFVYPRGTAVTARCRLRVYAGADGVLPTLGAVLPGAAIAAQ